MVEQRIFFLVLFDEVIYENGCIHICKKIERLGGLSRCQNKSCSCWPIISMKVQKRQDTWYTPVCEE